MVCDIRREYDFYKKFCKRCKHYDFNKLLGNSVGYYAAIVKINMETTISSLV